MGGVALHCLEHFGEATQLGQQIHDGASTGAKIVAEIGEAFPHDLDEVAKGSRAEVDELLRDRDQGGGADGSHVVVIVSETFNDTLENAVDEGIVLEEKIIPDSDEVSHANHASMAGMPDSSADFEVLLHDQPVENLVDCVYRRRR